MGYTIKQIRGMGKAMVKPRTRKRVGHGRGGKRARRLLSVRKRR